MRLIKHHKISYGIGYLATYTNLEHLKPLIDESKNKLRIIKSKI